MKRIFFDNERLFVNSQEVRGVQSVDLSQSLNIEPVSCLGTGFFGKEVGGPLEGELSVSQIVVTGADYFSGFDNISGNFYYANTLGAHTLSWGVGRMKSYKLTAEVNSLVTIDTSHTVYGGFYDGSLSPSAQTDIGEDSIARPYFVQSNIPFDTGDIIQSINYEITANYKTRYFLGSGLPELELVKPLEITTTIQANVSSYEWEDFRDACDLESEDLEIVMKNCDGDTIKTVRAPNSTLDSISFGGQIRDQLKMTAVYKAYTNTVTGLIT